MDYEVYDLIGNKIYINNEKININAYLKDIIYNYINMMNNEVKSSLLVTIDKERVEGIILIIMAIESFLETLKNSKTKILDELESGDIVVYNSDRVKYEGREVIYGKEKIVLSYEDSRKSRVMINLEDAYKLSIFDGEYAKLSTMKNDKKTYKNSGKFLFSKLVGENIEQFIGVIDQQILVTFPSKLYMDKLISNIKIEIEGVLYDFTQVFPCKYYNCTDNGSDLKGNKLKTKELFIFTSRLDISKELIRTNKKIFKLILLGENTYKNYIGGILDNILSKKRLSKIIIHNTYENIEFVENIIEKEIDVYSWDEQIIKKRFGYIDTILNNNINTTTDNIVIENDELNKAFFEIRKNMVNILKYNDEIVDSDLFIRTVFSLLSLLQRVAIPLEEYIEYCEDDRYFEDIIISLKQISEKNIYHTTSKNLINSVIGNLENLCNLMYNKNPKIEILKNIVSTNSIIVCSNEIEKNILKQDVFNQNIVITSKEYIKNKYINKELIFTSLYKEFLNKQLPYIHENNVKNILYYTDIIRYNSKLRHLNKSLYSISKVNKVKGSKEHKDIELVVYERNIFNKEKLQDNDINQDINVDEENEALIEHYTNEIIDINEIDYNLGELLYMNTYISDCTEVNYYTMDSSDIKNKIIYSDGRCSYLTKNFKSLCIKHNGEYVLKSTNNLEVGDQIVFINEKSEEDLFDLFHKIVNSDIFKSRYSKDYNNMRYWKYILKDYVDRYNSDYDLVSQELKIYGLDKVDVCVRQWINDDKIIGPREKDAYKAIGKVTRDTNLLNNWEEIYESCNRIRRFRTKFKKTFKNMVKMSIMKDIDEKDELQKLVIDVFGDLKEYADIVKIIDIEHVIEDIDNVRKNCIIEEDNVKGGIKNECVSTGV